MKKIKSDRRSADGSSASSARARETRCQSSCVSATAATSLCSVGGRAVRAPAQEDFLSQYKMFNRVILVIFLCAFFANLSCTPRSFEKPKTDAATPIAAEDAQAVFESELEKMRTANLQYIFVFRRKDGNSIDGEDKRFLRASLPFNNRVVLADEDKAVIVGSNFKFPPENTDALRMRFNVEDYSTAEQPK